MRRFVLVSCLPLLALAAPAVAQPVDPLFDEEFVAQEQGSRLADALPHPFEIEEAGDRLGRTVGAIMDVPVGDVVRSLDPGAAVPPDATLGEVAGRGDPDYRGHVEDQLGAMSLKLADAMRLLRSRAPAIERSLRDLRRNLETALPE